MNKMTSNIEKQSQAPQAQILTLAPSRLDIFPFEKLPTEIRLMVYKCVLISPCGWFNIVWSRTRRSKISLTEELSRTDILSNMCISILYLNKSIYQEACEVLYGSNLFHFDFPIDSCEGPHADHNVVTFLTSLGETPRRCIRGMRIYASNRRLEETSPGAGWPSMCRYLASKVQLQHLALVVVNNCSIPESDMEDMQRLCQSDRPWAKYLAWISGLKSFTLHTARCPFRDAPFEGQDKCPTTLPLASEVVHTFNETHLWTEEDHTSGLVIKYREGFEYSKNPMTRHLERHHFAAFYNAWYLGACISPRFKERLRIELGIDPCSYH